MEIALTFDDGPDPRWTPLFSERLWKLNMPATFFCIAERAKQHPNSVADLVAAGHQVGNHSYSHPNLWFRSSSAVRDELQRAQEVLARAAGKPPSLFRPPFGDRGPQVLHEAKRLGLTTVLWSLSGKDWNNPEQSWIVNRVLRRVRDGEIVLFHDASHDQAFPDRRGTLDAVCELVPVLKRRGFKFVTVGTMIAHTREAMR
jgi:peptidoglycan/xylan/chitin deacetylase (PgdA/CDA1 family)